MFEKKKEYKSTMKRGRLVPTKVAKAKHEKMALKRKCICPKCKRENMTMDYKSNPQTNNRKEMQNINSTEKCAQNYY